MVHYAVNTYQVLSYFCIKHVFYFIYSDALTFRCFDTWGLADPGGTAPPRGSQFIEVVWSSSASGLPWEFSGKESVCQCRRQGFNPWVGKIPWRRKWQPTAVFLPGESHGQRSLEGCSP